MSAHHSRLWKKARSSANTPVLVDGIVAFLLCQFHWPSPFILVMEHALDMVNKLYDRV
jgi:hypothetical protein